MSEIALPHRVDSGGGRAGRAPTIDAGNVPQARLASDPGVNVPRGAFADGEGMVAVGKGLNDLADPIALAGYRQQRLLDANATTEARLGYDKTTMQEWDRRQTQDDPSRPGFMKEYEEWLDNQAGQTLSGLPKGVSDHARERLRLTLVEKQRVLGDAAGKTSLIAGQQKAIDLIGAQSGQWSAQTARDPQLLDAVLSNADEGLKSYNGALTPNQERDARTKARAGIVSSALTGFVQQGKFQEARDLLASQKYDSDIDVAKATNYVTTQEREANIRAIPIQARAIATKYIGDPSSSAAPDGTFQRADFTKERRAPTEADTGPGMEYVKQGAAPSSQVGAAIRGTEWSGSGQSPTSVDGAVGNSQILPSTFAQYARPGEDIKNPADNAAVGQRIVDDLYQKYKGDPARVAVGYFSGPGNVAPEGSPTPWLRDAVDGNGQSTSGYVAKVASRLGSMSKSGMKMDEATALAHVDQDYADNPALGRAVAAEIRSRYAIVNMGMLADDKARKDQIAQTTDGYITKIIDPATPVSDLTKLASSIAHDPTYANDPEARWKLYEHVRQRVEDVTQGKMATDGAGFWQAYKRMFLPAGDPNRISDATQVFNLAGPGDDNVSLQGAQKLNGILTALQKPETAAVEQQKKRVFDGVHSALTHADEFLRLKDPKGETLFDQWSSQALRALDDGVKAGIPAMDMLTPSSKNFIGATAEGFKRSPEQWMQDRVSDSPIDAAARSAGFGQPVDFNSPQDLATARASNKISDKELQDIAIKKGWIRPNISNAPPPAAPRVLAPPIVNAPAFDPNAPAP